MKKSFLLFLLVLSTLFSYGQTSFDSLQLQIDSLLAESSNPAVAVSIVKGDSILLATSFGIKNLETQALAGDSTLFRIGSISKMFVALAVLKLQEEGKISLKDKLKDWAPEIEYENKWSDTHPILIEHLLEHTTGWDDLHLTEYAHGGDGPVSLKEGLDYHPHSRISRWIPGSRMSYCNSGPPVAAYIVEKITGQPFEAYVQQSFFDPIGMKNATYYFEGYEANGVTLYEGKKPLPYWHIIMRPSGSINATAMDMAKMLQFFINDAMVDSSQIISLNSLNRMETPKTTIGANAGVETGYGLNNYSSTWNGFPFQGHNGGVNGGSSEFVYNRNLDLGFAVMINSSNSNFRSEVSQLIAKFLTKDYEAPENDLNPTATQAFDGYYYPINPRQQLNYFNDRIFRIKKVWSDDSLVYLADFPSGTPTNFRATSDQLAYGPSKKIQMALAKDPLKGSVLVVGSSVYAPTSGIAVWVTWGFAALWFIGLLTAGVWMLISIIRLLLGSEKLAPIHGVQIGPVLIAISLFLFLGFLSFGGIQDPMENLAKPTSISKTVYIASLLMGTFSFMGVGISAFTFSKVNRGFTYWYFTILALMSLIVTIYLWDHGAIGLKTWG